MVGIKASLTLTLNHCQLLISAVTPTLGSALIYWREGHLKTEINHNRNRHPENVNSIKHRQEINHCQPLVTSAMLLAFLFPTLVPGEGL